VVTNSEVLVVSPSLDNKTARELVALTKQKPGGITFASTGIGAPPYLAQVLFAADELRAAAALAASANCLRIETSTPGNNDPAKTR
jgi:tripartite-type tricarboxylate transporter receptor subunit TctC